MSRTAIYEVSLTVIRATAWMVSEVVNTMDDDMIQDKGCDYPSEEFLT
jgi:hypothetical protein